MSVYSIVLNTLQKRKMWCDLIPYSSIIDLKFYLFKSQNINSNFPNKRKHISVERCFRDPFLLFVNECLLGECMRVLMNWLGCYARVVDHLATKNVVQGAPLGGGATLHLKVISKTMEARNSRNTRLTKKKGGCRISTMRWAWLLGYTYLSHQNPPWHLLHVMQPPRTYEQKPPMTLYRTIYW
jgi:hypothetical protein